MSLQSQTAEAGTFSGLSIEPKILDELHKLKFITPTPIQHKCIPIALEGKDIIGVAQTGTGKTLAFGIPIIQHLIRKNGKALILLPTRELAIQVEQEIRKIGYSFGARSTVLIGGSPIGRQKQALRQDPQIIIGTPGRIIDHLQQKSLNLSSVNMLVLDEADRMLDMGFAPQIRQILKMVPKNKQTMLFSATMPGGIVKIAMEHMKFPIRVEIAPQGTTAERVEQEVFIVPSDKKIVLLEALLHKYMGTVLVFTRTKYGAKKICKALNRNNHSAAEIHSNRSLSQRTHALQGFKSGRYRILVATDIAARGIDVKDIELVINYDIPEQAEDYVHRIGRTARAGQEGRAITFAMPDQKQKVTGIERLIRMALKISVMPGLSTERNNAPMPPRYEEDRPFKTHPKNSSGRRKFFGRKKFHGNNR